MVDYLTGDESDAGSFRRNRVELQLPGYRFGRRHERHSRGRSALNRAHSYLRDLIQSVADAKFRRMRREVERASPGLDRLDELWMPDELRNRDRTK